MMLNNKAITLMRNFSYTLSSNLISIIISAILILIVPRLVGVEEYGYWQLYLFYSAYMGFLHFGWNDGIYLRYGGQEYSKLCKELLYSQFWMLVIFQILIGISIISILSIFSTDDNKMFILEMTVLSLLIVNVRLMLIYILQCTNRIKEYAQITMMEKVLYCSLVLMFLLLGIRQYKLLIIADITGKLVSFVYSTYCCRDIVFNKVSLFYFTVRETFNNVSIGIKLMLSNVASMFIIGISRFGIEHAWDISTFGKVSLTLSISNLMMLFINAIGIIMFPVLRRTNKEKLSPIYTTMRNFLMVLLIGLLSAYFPLKVILSAWLIQYHESLMYMALLFPICIYEGKMSLLINTYLKTLRKENIILKINIVSAILSIIITMIFTLVFKNLALVIVSIVILLSFRCILAEVLLSRMLDISVYKDILLEMTMTLIFMLSGWFFTSSIGLALYLCSYGLYLFIKRREIKATVIDVKQLVLR